MILVWRGVRRLAKKYMEASRVFGSMRIHGTAGRVLAKAPILVRWTGPEDEHPVLNITGLKVASLSILTPNLLRIRHKSF